MCLCACVCVCVWGGGVNVMLGAWSLWMSVCYCICLYDLLGSPDSSVGKALDLWLEGCRFKSGIGRSMWDYFHMLFLSYGRDIKLRTQVNLSFKVALLLNFEENSRSHFYFKVALLLNFEENSMSPSYSKSPSRAWGEWCRCCLQESFRKQDEGEIG